MPLSLPFRFVAPHTSAHFRGILPAHHARHADLFRLTADYLEHQRSGMPVHEWAL